MESNNFLSKPSFALLVWLVISVSIATHSRILDSAYKAAASATRGVDESISQLWDFGQIQTAKVAQLPFIAKFIPDIPSSDLQCMAENIYYEAANQSYAGKIAVGQVVLNRQKTTGFPNTVCGVIHEGSHNVHTAACQFSWSCAPHNPINTSSEAWLQSQAIAKELLEKKDSIADITEGATSYHADYVKPAWATHLKFVTQIDQHLFYK